MRKLRDIELGSWLGGKYWDWWMVIHLLSGLILGLALRLLGVPAAFAFVTAFVLILLWEIFELIRKIYEPTSNILIDVIVGLIGYFLAFYAIPSFGVTADVSILAAVVVVWLVLEYSGWRSWRRRVKKSKL